MKVCLLGWHDQRQGLSDLDLKGWAPERTHRAAVNLVSAEEKASYSALQPTQPPPANLFANGRRVGTHLVKRGRGCVAGDSFPLRKGLILPLLVFPRLDFLWSFLVTSLFSCHVRGWMRGAPE